MAISPLDCMGCAVCVGQCPVNALTMVPQEDEAAQQDVFNYCVASVSEKKDMQDNTVKGSQFRQPMLEFSGSYLQRHRLLLHLGRSGCHLSLLHQQGRPRPRLVQLPVRG